MKYASEQDKNNDKNISVDEEKQIEKITDNNINAEKQNIDTMTQEEKNAAGKRILNEDAAALKPVMERMAKSYDKKPAEMSDKEWLQAEFKKELPDKTDEECKKYAEEITKSIADQSQSIKELNKYCDEGGIKEKWLSNKLADACTGMSVIEYGNYLSEIDNTLAANNWNMFKTLVNTDGSINQNPNLHGFIAEQALANSFNKNAALQGSVLRAEVLKPESGYTKNSVDIVISDGKCIYERDQVKFCKDATETAKAFRHGDYRGQQKIVPEEQALKIAEKFPNSKVKGHIGGENTNGIASDKLSREEAVRIKETKEFKEANWNSYNTRDLAYNIGKQAVYAGAGAAVMVAGLDVAVKKLSGEKVDTSETMELAFKTGADAGAKAATAGALKVAAEKGTLSIIPKGVSGFAVGTLACLAIENAKIAYKYASGEISGTKAADMVGRVSCATIGGSLGGLTGGVVAAALVANPVGAAVAGVAGMLAGGMAGSSVGEKVYEGVKKVGKGVATIAKKACDYVVSDIKRRASETGKALDNLCEGNWGSAAKHALNAILPSWLSW